MLVRRVAAFAFTAALATSAGQTFFIGLFGEAFRDAFALSEAALGLIYGSATLVSGLSMFWLGGMADRLSLRRAVTLSVALVIAGAALVAGAGSVASLALGLFLLRLGGQGLTGHFAVVAAARHGGLRRGRVLATATIGFIAGEALFPVLVIAALGAFDWQATWAAVAVVMALVFLPALRYIARPFPRPPAAASGAGDVAPRETRWSLLRSPPFVSTLGIVLVSPFVVTAIFFHQSSLAGRLGWPPGSIAFAFMVFAAAQGIAAIAAGRFADRYSARALAPYYLLPMAAGLVAAVMVPGVGGLWLLFAGLGIAAGGNGVVAGAVWVELFGSARLGLVRGVYAAMMVISTAVSPVVLGALLSAGVPLERVFGGVAVYIVFAPWLLARLMRM